MVQCITTRVKERIDAWRARLALCGRCFLLRITGLRQHWSFAEMYSAFATQGVGEKGKPIGREALAPLAKTNVESLAEFGFFTAAREAGKRLEFSEPVDY